MNKKTMMQREAEEFPSIVEKHLNNFSCVEEVIRSLKQNPPSFICTLARGSSGYAAHFAKYIIENKLQILVHSFAPSICTIYKSPLIFKSTLFLAISQSGQSTDLVQTFHNAKSNGANTLAFVNCENSPLYLSAQHAIPLCAGEEKSVAATKSFLASLSRLVQFVSLWTKDEELISLYHNLPNNLLHVLKTYSWDCSLFPTECPSLFVIGRGYSFPIAQEAALKIKETCGIHAEAFSGAELMHGPLELIGEKFPVIVFLQKDETLSSQLELLNLLKNKKATVFVIGAEDILSTLSRVHFNLYVVPLQSSYPILDLIFSLHCFYLFVSNLSVLRGRNPDKPKNLNKVTKTL